MFSTSTTKRILLTGPPGIGKTTLIKKICSGLQENNIPVRGFYTEEVRDEETNMRTGFDLVTLDGTHEKLARIEEYLDPDDVKDYKVGQYVIFPQNVNTVVRSVFKENEDFNEGIIILDEIGKMELFSKKFQKLVTDMFKKKHIRILATVPLKRKALPLVASLVDDLKNNLVIVDRTNRNGLVDEIVQSLQS